MAFFETLMAAVTSKAAAATAGLTIVAGTVAVTVAQDVPAQPPAEQTARDDVRGDRPEIELDDLIPVDDPSVAGDDVTVLQEEEVADAAENDEGENGNEVSEAVHGTLSGNDLRPGDDGFGEAVAENATTNDDFGREVSEAAREANGSAERSDTGDDSDDSDDDAGASSDAAATGQATASQRNGGNSDRRGPNN